MTFSLGYLLYRAYYRFVAFWTHWYIEVFFVLQRVRVVAIAAFDRRFLNQENPALTTVARTVFFVIVTFISWLVYIIWCALPAFILYQAFKNYLPSL